DNEFLWRFGERKRFGTANDYFPVKFCERRFYRRATGGDDNVVRFNLLRLTIGGFNGNLSRGDDRAQTFENSDLVGLHQRTHAAVECFYDSILALLHLSEIGMRAFNDDAVFRCLFFNEHEMIARGEKRFARDAAHVQASAT